MSRLIGGQVTLTTSAQQLTSTQYEISAILVKPLSGNVDDMYIGPSGVTASTGYPLSPGEAWKNVTVNRQGEAVVDIKPSDIYVVGTAGDKVAWQALRA